jgi:hypothetical protein
MSGSLWFGTGEWSEVSQVFHWSPSFLIIFALVITAGRVYTDGADRPHYKCLFDELQKIILRLTGKNLRFKRFTRGGNLVTMGVDLEAAQVQGASDSFLPTNEPEYSGITTTDPDEFVMYFVRACISHCKQLVPLHNPLPHHPNFLRSKGCSRT